MLRHRKNPIKKNENNPEYKRVERNKGKNSGKVAYYNLYFVALLVFLV